MWFTIRVYHHHLKQHLHRNKVASEKPYRRWRTQLAYCGKPASRQQATYNTPADVRLQTEPTGVAPRTEMKARKRGRQAGTASRARPWTSTLPSAGQSKWKTLIRRTVWKRIMGSKPKTSIDIWYYMCTSVARRG